MNTEQLKKRLNQYLDLKLDLLVTNNRSTMLNLLEKKRKYARLSLHRMFLQAPDPVISAIARYVRGTRKESSILRGYIQDNLSRYEQSNGIQLDHEGEIYNLKQICEKLNHLYFDSQLDLKITWYGRKGRKNRSRVTFGQYQESLKLVKVHRFLDDPFFPDYFVSFIVYHEMLHGVIPGYIDEKGWYRTHGAAFKEKERNFEHYEAAIAWERENKWYFFR